jgi:hypothetical protein
MFKGMMEQMPDEQKQAYDKFMEQKLEQELYENKMAGYKNSLIVIDPETGTEEALKLSGYHFDYSNLSPDGKYLAFTVDEISVNDRTIWLLEAPFNGDPISLVNLGSKDNDGFDGLVWGPASDLLLIKRKHTVSAFDVKKQEFVREFSTSKNVDKVSVSPDGKYLFTQGEALRIHSFRTGTILADLIAFRDGEWILITPEGYFDLSSMVAAKRMGVSFGIKAYNINQFYDLFFRPSFVRAALREQPIPTSEQLTLEEVIMYPPPVVKILSCSEEDQAGKVKVTYLIQSIGESGIGEVRIFNNGKLIYSDAQYTDLLPDLTPVNKTEVAKQKKSSANRGAEVLTRFDDKKSTVDPWIVKTPEKTKTYEDEITIQTVPGENEIGITAYNRENSVQSLLETTQFYSHQTAQPRDIYVLAIGIDKYLDPSSNLNFAVKDARDMGGELQKLHTNRYDKGNIHIKYILDENATRENILKTLKELAGKIRPFDDFVLFVAGHGVLLDGAKYAILTHNYDGKAAKTGQFIDIVETIGSHEVMSALRKIQAQGQLVILDTCHAGGIDQLVADLYKTRMSIFAKKMGLHIYASASSKEGALDGYRGNGLFTSSLLNGLRNNQAADVNSDQQVSVVEWGSFAKQKTINIARQLHHNQNPLIINFGQDRVVYELQ